MGLKASLPFSQRNVNGTVPAGWLYPIAHVARPASHIVQSNSGAGSFLESYDRRSAPSPAFDVFLYMAVTALAKVSGVA